MKQVLFLFILFCAEGLTAQEKQKVYVWNFVSDSLNAHLAKRITEEFEIELIKTNKYIVLNRRDFAEILKHVQNEKEIQNLNDLPSSARQKFAAKNAEVVIFGQLLSASAGSKYHLSIKFQNLSSSVFEIAWQDNFTVIEFKDDDKRLKAITKVVCVLTNANSFCAEATNDLTKPFISEKKPDIPLVKICSQTWMAKNLDVSTYRNGDLIPEVRSPHEWSKLTTGAWCWYDNDSAQYAAVYGKLYNWYAINDPRGLAPQGWQIPSNYDWGLLADCVGGDSVAGNRLKSTLRWSQNTAYGGNNFAALPGGYRWATGAFSEAGLFGIWWSSSIPWEYASHYKMIFDQKGLYQSLGDKTNGYSVRCVRY